MPPLPTPTNPNVLTTTAGNLPFSEYHLALAGHEWRILHTGAVLSHADEQRFLGGEQPKLPYGIVLWPASIALAHEVAARPMKGLRVLELGAGTGLPGIVAAKLGASVVQTDRQDLALHISQRNAERNGVTIDHRLADWTMWEDTEKYDLILGADVLYAEFMHDHLLPIFEQNLKPGGSLLLSDPFRGESYMLLEAMAASGWKVSMNKWTVGIRPPERVIGVFELTKSA